MRRTKIIATVGPASDSDSVLDALIAAGTDIFRLNFSHGTRETHSATFARVRAAAGRAGRHVAILQDLAGPKIRTGPLVDHKAFKVQPGDRLEVATGDFAGGPGRVSTTFEGLASSVRPGDRLLLSDGRIELRVDSRDGAAIHTTVVEGGDLGEHKGINAPGVALPASAITPKDVEDLRVGLSLGVDMVALSFVRTADDLRKARGLMSDAGAADVPLMAKLERPQALDHLDDILSACDAVMVARGDLGLELPLERVPRAQKEIIHAARKRGTPVVVATQVLESMIVEPRPTRAEVNDAADAVDDGVDAIMLAGETAVGAHAVRAVRTLHAIMCEAEAGVVVREFRRRRASASTDHAQALCDAAVTLAEHSDAKAIVAVTRGGHTARRLSALRPSVPILAITNQEDIARRLAICWGVTPVRTDIGEAIESAGRLIGAHLVDRGFVAAGSTVVLARVDADLTRVDANYLKIHRL
jgi:pyruvate kinase